MILQHTSILLFVTNYIENIYCKWIILTCVNEWETYSLLFLFKTKLQVTVKKLRPKINESAIIFNSIFLILF